MALITVPHSTEANLQKEISIAYLGSVADGFIFPAYVQRIPLKQFKLVWTQLPATKAEEIVAAALQGCIGGNRLIVPNLGAVRPMQDFLLEKWSMDTADITLSLQELKA